MPPSKPACSGVACRSHREQSPGNPSAARGESSCHPYCSESISTESCFQRSVVPPRSPMGQWSYWIPSKRSGVVLCCQRQASPLRTAPLACCPPLSPPRQMSSRGVLQGSPCPPPGRTHHTLLKCLLEDRRKVAVFHSRDATPLLCAVCGGTAPKTLCLSVTLGSRP